MKVVIFGGSGFLGSHVADVLSKQGHDVTIFDRVKSRYLQKGQKMVEGDFLDFAKVEKILKSVDVVYHFAGIADIDEATDKPMDTVKYNIYGTTVILDACIKAKVKKFIFASSVYVYSNSGSFYRVSKQSCELLIEAYNEKYGLEYVIMRYGSLYGPRSDQRNGIYRFLHQAIKEKRIVYHGKEDDLREYIHVHDAARLSAEVLKKEFSNQHIIITGQQMLSAKHLLTMIKEMLKNDIDIVIDSKKGRNHYQITPYNFSPKLGKKLVDRSYCDMGQGLLEVMAEIFEKVNSDYKEDLGYLVKEKRKKK